MRNLKAFNITLLESGGGVWKRRHKVFGLRIKVLVNRHGEEFDGIRGLSEVSLLWRYIHAEGGGVEIGCFDNNLFRVIGDRKNTLEGLLVVGWKFVWEVW